jgi:hypothetical protein
MRKFEGYSMSKLLRRGQPQTPVCFALESEHQTIYFNVEPYLQPIFIFLVCQVRNLELILYGVKAPLQNDTVDQTLLLTLFQLVNKVGTFGVQLNTKGLPM